MRFWRVRIVGIDFNWLLCFLFVFFFFFCVSLLSFFFFFNDTATTEIYTLSLHDALPIPIPSALPLAVQRIWLC